MALILHGKYEGKKGLFLRNRILRIYPLYLIVLTITVLASFYWTSNNLQTPIDAFFKDAKNIHWTTFYYLVFQNIAILTQGIGSFFSVNQNGILFFSPHASSTYPFIYTHSFIPQAWTLSIEFLFYAAAPFLVKRKTYLIILLALVSIILRVFIYSLGLHHEPWINKFAPTEFLFFLAGILAFRIYLQIKDKTFNKSLFVFFYFALLIVTIMYDVFPKLLHLPINPIQGIYFLMLFILTPFIFHFFKDSKMDKFIGDLSYPIYISHILVIYTIRNSHLRISANTASILSVTISVLFSILLLKTAIRYIETFRNRGLPAKSLPNNFRDFKL